MYSILEWVYENEKISQITPPCYGAFEGDRIYTLMLELCSKTLNDWNELKKSEQ
jgi:hypothetical protein